MVSQPAYKEFTEALSLIHKYRKLTHKLFIEKESKDVFQLLMWAVDTRGNLTAVLCLTSHPAFKYAVPVDTLFNDFTCDDAEVFKEAVNG